MEISYFLKTAKIVKIAIYAVSCCHALNFGQIDIYDAISYHLIRFVCLFVCFQTKTSYSLSLFEVDKQPTVANASGLQCLFLIPPDNVVLCNVA